MDNQTVLWLNYFHKPKTYYNQTVETDEDDPTRGKWEGVDVVLDENGVWYEDFDGQTIRTNETNLSRCL